MITAASVLAHYHSMATFCLALGLSEDSESIAQKLKDYHSQAQLDLNLTLKTEAVDITDI